MGVPVCPSRTLFDRVATLGGVGNETIAIYVYLSSLSLELL
jgi:hypothetical protein